jgi:hypothetical protein
VFDNNWPIVVLISKTVKPVRDENVHTLLKKSKWHSVHCGIWKTVCERVHLELAWEDSISALCILGEVVFLLNIRLNKSKCMA